MQAEYTLFRVHRGILLLHSPACQDILTMPSGVPNDGALDDHPNWRESHWPSLSSFVLGCIICKTYYRINTTGTNTIYSGSQPNQLDEAALITILKVSRFWLVEEIITWAINRLEELNLSPA